MQAQWEQHKATIRDLYLTQDKTLKDVISHMQETHGFRARLVPLQLFGMLKSTGCCVGMPQDHVIHVTCRAGGGSGIGSIHYR